MQTDGNNTAQTQVLQNIERWREFQMETTEYNAIRDAYYTFNSISMTSCTYFVWLGTLERHRVSQFREFDQQNKLLISFDKLI